MKLKITDIFKDKPSIWGLRGDPYLWTEIQLAFEKIEIHIDEIEFEQKLYNLFKQFTGHDIFSQERVFVKRYDMGGMSSGHVSTKFWLTEGIPLLKERFKQKNEKN